jgi:hypothetical protein
MNIQPCVSAGIVFMHEDGKFEMTPFQIFPLKTGGSCIRIGRNAIYFNEDGSFDGTECAPPRSAVETNEKLDALGEGFQRSGENRGLAPATTYFGEGSPGYEAEVAGWPT